MYRCQRRVQKAGMTDQHGTPKYFEANLEQVFETRKNPTVLVLQRSFGVGGLRRSTPIQSSSVCEGHSLTISAGFCGLIKVTLTRVSLQHLLKVLAG